MNYKKTLPYWVAILASSTVHAELIEFSNGDKLDVTIIGQTASTITFDHAALGQQTIDKMRISNLQDLRLDAVKMTLAATPAPVTPEEKTATAEEPEGVDDGLFGTGWFQGWDSSVDLGMTGSSGPTENFNFRLAFATRYEDDDGRWDFKTYYINNSQDNELTANKINATLLKDWFFKDTDWFAFSSMVYDFDRFKDWDHRLQVSAGPGYQFIKTDDWELSGRMGGTGVFEFGGEVDGAVRDDTQSFEVMIGADSLWQISAKQSFSISNYVFSRVTDGGKIRNVTDIAWQHELEYFEGLAIKFNVHNEYDMSQEVQRNKNDLQYGVSLGLGF